MDNKNKIYHIAILGILISLVFIGSMFSIQIPVNLGGTPTRIHMGNVFCLLSSFILGPLSGGIAAGIGSAIYDLINPLFFSLMPFTFLFKFVMAYVCGKISYMKGNEGKNIKVNIIAGILAILVYLILHLGRSALSDIFFKNIEIKTTLINFIMRFLTSILNGIIAVGISVPLNLLIRNALEDNNMFEKIRYNEKKMEKSE